MRKDVNGPSNTPWQVGDLALCISAKPFHLGPKPGSVSTVSAVTMGRTSQGLRLKEFPSHHNPLGFKAKLFIKATPLEEDGFDRETLNLERYKKKTKPLVKGMNQDEFNG